MSYSTDVAILAPTGHVPTDVVPTQSYPPATSFPTELWPEPLNTPGIIPRHLKRSATASFPILEVLQRILSRLRPQGTTSDLEKVLALIGLYQAARPVYGYLRDLFFWVFTVEITVAESDPIAREVLAWMGENVLRGAHTRSAMLVTGGLDTVNLNAYTGHAQSMRFSPPPPPGSRQDRVHDEVACLPPIGTRIFWVGFRPFLFSRNGSRSSHRNAGMSTNTVNDRGQLQNALTISTLGWSLSPLRRFTDLCHEFKLKNLTGTTTVYFAGDSAGPYGRGEGWQSVSKAIRRLDTIDMDEATKLDLILDAEHYYSEQQRQFFADCGIPYRRGYLFHGPPGTGKSSFSAALAGHLQCDIYHINLASGDFSDGSLHRLFLGLPRKCVVVIEDIDSAGIGREQGPATEPRSTDEDAEASMPYIPPKIRPLVRAHGYTGGSRNTVTLSGLLNAIDGNASQEGRLLIMTSNNPDALDDALTRPGRIDKKVYFGNMTKAAGKSIFMRLIGRTALAHDSAYTMADIEQYATDFAEKVPADKFTPAQIQNFLQGCRGDPVKALREVDAWLMEHREIPESTSNAGSSDMSASIISHITATDASTPPVVGGSDTDSNRLNFEA